MVPLRAALILATLILSTPFVVQAHSYGSFYEETVGPYLVDIGYDPPDPTTGDRLLFDFNLFEAGDKTAPVEFSHAWVRLEHNGEILLAGPVAKMPLGPTTLVVRMPQRSGELVVHARFERESAVLGEVSFPLTVVEPPGEWPLVESMVLAAGALVLIAGAFWFRKGVPLA